jgi:hypothetical protein
MSAWVAALFFARFWWSTRDRLIFFFLAFSLLSLNWLGLALVESAAESRDKLMLLRMSAFVLIIGTHSPKPVVIQARESAISGAWRSQKLESRL